MSPWLASRLTLHGSRRRQLSRGEWAMVMPHRGGVATRTLWRLGRKLGDGPERSCRFVAHYGCAFRRRNPVSPATYQVQGIETACRLRRPVYSTGADWEPEKSSI